VTFRVESTNRWDALALASRLGRYRWDLIEPDDRHWHVCVPVEQPSRDLPEHQASGDRVLVRIEGDCGAATLDRLNETLEAAIDRHPHEIVVDLAEATLVDSMTLGSLTAAAKRVRAHGGSFLVVGAQATEVRRAFEITGLDTYLLRPATR
jgi:anti-anti-sigma factor